MRLVPAARVDLPVVYGYMLRSFVRDEIRDYEDFVKVFENEAFTVFHIEEDGLRRGFITVWDLERTAFLEHFAIYEEFRNSGCGGRALESVKEKYKELVLEVELPAEPVQIRRIEFYKRHGFCLNGQEYFQPPYRRGGAPCPMKLMSYPRPLSDFAATAEAIRRAVYAPPDTDG